jgi:preprotein translocase subunit SecE
MAEKVQAEKKNRVVEYLLSEHKIENYLLLFLGVFAIELGVILLQGQLLSIPEEAWLIGGKTNTIIFSWILVGLGAISIALVAAAFYRPSIAEIKHISGLKFNEFLWNVVKVIGFSVVLALFFIGCDFVIEKFIQLMKNLLY